MHAARARSAPAPALAQQLGLAAGAPVFHTLIVHFENGVPLQCEDRYVNPACAPDYLRHDFTQTTPTQYLLQVAPLWRGAVLDRGRAAHRARGQAAGHRAATSPAWWCVRRTVSQDVPITLARLVHPGTRYLLQGEFRP